MLRISIILLFASAVGCFGQAGDGGRDKDALDVYEAVFRHHLKKEKADAIGFLSIDTTDPPVELLKRLRKEWPNLKPISELPKDMKALRVYANELKWTRGGAEVQAGYWFPTKVAGQGYVGTYHMIREKDTWKIAKVTDEVSS